MLRSKLHAPFSAHYVVDRSSGHHQRGIAIASRRKLSLLTRGDDLHFLIVFGTKKAFELLDDFFF